MNRLRIAHIRASEFYGGPERAILGQCMNHKEYHFCCISFTRGGQKNDFLEKARSNDIDIFRLKERFLADFLPIFELKKIIKKEKIGILVSHDYKSCFYSMIVSRVTGIKHVRHFRGFTNEDLKVKFYNKLDILMMKRVETILAVSEKSAQILAGLGVDVEKITVVPNAIDSASLVDLNFTRKKNSDNIKFICGGRLSFEKGYDLLINAIKLLNAKVANYKVDIYGDGPEHRNITNLINDNNLQDRVELKGFVNDIKPIMKQADCLILPSRSEGMPNIVLEAWSQKLAVVSMAVGGVPEMVSNNVDGIICEAGDIDQLAEALLKIIDGSVDPVELGEAGYHKVKDRYSYAAQNRILQQHYCINPL